MHDSTRADHPGRVLVLCGSPDRATGDIAAAIADELRTTGTGVDLLAPAQVGGLAGYRAVVIGSRVRFGHWHPAVVRFLRRHAAVLRVRPLWPFQVAPHLHRAAAGALTGLADEQLPRSVIEVPDQPAPLTFHPDGSVAAAHRTSIRPDGAGSEPRQWARTIAAAVREHDILLGRVR